MDRYRKQGMEYRFHDDASAPAARIAAESSSDSATGAVDDMGAMAHDDGHPTQTISDAS